MEDGSTFPAGITVKTISNVNKCIEVKTDIAAPSIVKIVFKASLDSGEVDTFPQTLYLLRVNAPGIADSSYKVLDPAKDIIVPEFTYDPSDLIPGLTFTYHKIKYNSN